MIRKCSECNKEKNTPYKDLCRCCYQKKWNSSITEKVCVECKIIFKTAGIVCYSCQRKKRIKNEKKLPCSSCNRTNVLIMHKEKILCNTCLRHMRERIDPEYKQKRTYQQRMFSRKYRGTPIDAPLRIRKGIWKTKEGYVLTFKHDHPNASPKGSIFVHTLVMSEKIGRPLKKGESVHHINGIRDDNRIENLELWHRGQPSGQRLEEKIKWAKEFLQEYGYQILMKKNPNLI